MKILRCVTVAIVAVVLCHASLAAVILFEGFNQATLPAGWSLSNGSWVSFVTSSSYPTALPYEGTHFVKFDSFDAPTGTRSFLTSPAMSTVGKTDVKVVFAWHRDPEYPDAVDRVNVQYSLNGTTWINVAAYPRTNTVTGWEVKTCALPAAATNQPTLYIGFLFYSAYGNNCYLDAVQVHGTLPGEAAPPASFTATAVSKSQINLAWQTNAAGDMVMVASNGVATFGVPSNGVAYAVGSALPGGGVIIYQGSALNYACTGLTPDTRYYYAAWSVNAATNYSTAVTATAKTFMAPIDSFPYFQDFSGAWPPASWSVIDNLGGGGVWELNTTWDRPNYAGGDGACADADSDAFGDAMDTELRATFDFSGMTKPVLKFITSYRDYGAYDSARTQISTNGGATWVTLANWTADISPFGPGSNIVFDLQAFAGQPNVILRFWYVSDWDWWWEIDNVYVYDKVPNVYLEPLIQSGAALPGRAVPYRLTAENASGSARNFTFEYESAWPVSGPGSSGVLADSAVTAFTVRVTVPATAYAGQACTTTVRAVSTDGIYTNSARLITRCTWNQVVYSELFNTWPNGWTNYPAGGPGGGWYYNTYYGAAAHNKVPGATNWLVSPAIDLTMTGVDMLELYFRFGCTADMVNVEGVYLSAGSRNPADGAYVRQADIEWLPGYWYWNYANIAPYAGSNPVYIGIAYLGPNDWQLVDSFYILGEKTGIDNAILTGPAALPPMTSYGSVPAITGALYAVGESGASGPAPFTTAELGFGPTGTVPDSATWTWFPAAYLGADGAYDVYIAAPQLTIAGPLNYCYRFRRGDANWVYADLDGSSNGFDLAKAGSVTVAMLPPRGALLRNQTISLDWVSGPSAFANPSNAPPQYYETADDLTLPYDAYIKSMRMGGVYWRAGRQNLEQGFWLRIYANAVTNPGTLLYEQYVPGYACEQLIGVDSSSLTNYVYHVDLATPFLAQAGNTYWLSLQHEVRNGTYWSLLDSPDTVRGLDACQRVAAGGTWSPLDGIDLGMEVYGDVTNAGTINGTVLDAESMAPIVGAQVLITNAVYVNAVLTDSNGFYTTPAPAGTYVITVTKANYLPATAHGVVVIVDATTTMNFLLEGSYLSVTPTNITRTMALGQQTVNTLVLSNSGPLAVQYTVRIGNFGAVTTVAKRITHVSLPPCDGNFPRGTAPLSLARAPRASASAPATMPAARAPLSAAVKAYGFNIYPADPNALISLMTDNPGGYTTIGTANTGPSGFVCGAAFLNGDFSKLYCLVWGDNKFVTVNTVNAAVTDIAACVPPTGENWTGLAAAPDGTLYASAHGSVSKLYRLNPATAAYTLVGQITGATLIIGIAINAAGEMYGLDIGADALVRINPATGAGTVIGSIGFDANYAQDLAFDLENNVLYLAAYNNTTSLGELRVADTTTGNTTLIGQFSPTGIEVDGFETMTAAGMKWARVETNAGTVAAGSVGTLNVIFDASVVSNFGDYTAELVLEGTFVNQLAPVPLKMSVLAGPIISAPSMLNFGEVVIGDTTNLPLEVSNIGIGVLSGQITAVSAPFSVIGTDSYAIPGSGSSTHTISFAPSTEGVYTNIAVLTGGGDTTVTLIGTGIPEPTLWLAVLLLGMGGVLRRRFGVRER